MSKRIICISKLKVCYQDNQAISDLSLNIHTGEVVALLGENGAGKSTLINAILGRIKPTAGDIQVFGQQPGSYAAKLRIGSILQSANLPDNTTIEEQLNLFRSYYSNSLDLDTLLRTTMLEGLQKRQIETLSGGQKQRVFFALAICGKPDVIFLDEPTVGLDISARREFWHCIETLKQQGAAIVLTTHYLEEAEALADQIVLLNKGVIINRGTPAQIKAQVTGKRVRFLWPQQAPPFAEFLRNKALPMGDSGLISQVLDDNGRIEFISPQPELILKTIFANDYVIQDLSVESIKFEDAILSINQNYQSNLAEEKAA